jgi:hypothetical protein
MDLAAAVADIVTRLQAGGVRAVTDARDVNPPCVQVRAPIISYRFGKGYWDAEWTAWAITGDAGTAENLTAQGDLITKAQAALEGAVVTARPDDALMPDGSLLPIYVLNWSARIT